MKRIIFLFIFSLTITPIFSQTQLYVDPEFSQIGSDHKLIAVIPFKTSISLRPKQMKELKDGDLERMEQNESQDVQNSMFSWFLKRKQQGKLWVDIQEITLTNAILEENGINYFNIDEYKPNDIAKILGVDALIRGTFETNKPMSDGASLALGLLVGYFGATNKATINMFIHNGLDGKVLVNYHKGVAGSLGSSTDNLINIIMRKASRRIPYTKSDFKIQLYSKTSEGDEF